MRTSFSSERALLNSRLYKRASLGGGLFVRENSAAYLYITNDSLSLYFLINEGNGDYSVYASNHGMIDNDHQYCAIREDGGLSADALPLILTRNAESNTRLTSKVVNTLGKVSSAKQDIPYIINGNITTAPYGENTILLVMGTPDEVYHINGHVEVKSLVILGCNLIVHGDINATDHIYAYCRSISAHHVTGGVDAIYANSLHWTYTPGWNSVCSNHNGGCKEVLHNLTEEMFSAMADRGWITEYQKEKLFAQRFAIAQSATNNKLTAQYNHALQRAIDANEALATSAPTTTTIPASATTASTPAPALASTTTLPVDATDNTTNTPSLYTDTPTTTNNDLIALDSPDSNLLSSAQEPIEQKLVEIDTTVPISSINNGFLALDDGLSLNDEASNENLANSITPVISAPSTPTTTAPVTTSTPREDTVIAADASNDPTSTLTLDQTIATSPIAPSAITTAPVTEATTNETAVVAPTLATAPVATPTVAAPQTAPEIPTKIVTETDVYKLLADPNTPLTILETIVDTLDGTFLRQPQNDNDYRKLAKAFILKLLRKSKQELLEVISSVLTLAQYEEQLTHPTSDSTSESNTAKE